MRSTMERIAAAVGLVLMIVSVVAAHPDTVEQKGMNKELAMKNFEYSLQWRGVPGIVESTIYNVVIFKNRFPDLDYSHIGVLLQRVAEGNKDLSISYKAQLATMYLNYSPTLDLTSQTLPADHEYIFKQISEQFEQKFLASHATE